MKTQAIRRRRGDTVAIPFEVVDSTGAVEDITGASFKLTVNSEEFPTDISNQVFQSIGTITDALNGLVDFPVSPTDADNLGDFYYDVQMTDASTKLATLAAGRFIMTQDITKAPETMVYLFEGTLDELLPNDGDLWIVSADESSPARSAGTLPGYRVYDTRDAVNLLAKPYETRVTDGYTTSLHLAGSLAPSFTGNVDMMVVFFWHSIASVDFTIGLMAGPHELAWGLVGKLRDTISVEFTLYRGDGITAGGFDYGGRVKGDAWEEGEGMSEASNWYRMRLQLDRTNGVVRLKWWLDADAEPFFWNHEHNDTNLATLGRLYPMIRVLPRMS